MRRAWGVVGLLFCLFLGEARGEFRFDEVEPRSFFYNDEYFINAFNYRQRITLRWRWDDGWDSAAVGYAISAGSLRSRELLVEQRARVRLPFADHLSGEYRFIESEDYDARYRRNEVEVLFRFFRPELRRPLSETLGDTPPPDGLFFGGTGVLDAEKEFADIGLAVGWRDEHVSLRLDAVGVDFFFNDKNGQAGEYDGGPYTLKAAGGLRLLSGDLRLSGWFVDDLPFTLSLAETSGGLRFRYRKLLAGLRAAWQPRHDLRFDVEVHGERTRKRARAGDPDPALSYETDRYALKAYGMGEVDVGSLWGEGASHDKDTVLLGAHLHLLDEDRRRPLPLGKRTERRGEAYGELGYVLAIPSPGEGYRFGLRASAMAGFASLREVEPGTHSVNRKLIAKLIGGFEAILRGGDAHMFFQMTWRVDNMTFGGGNAQVMMRF